MKILFIQNTADVIGGVEFVNKALAEGFAKRGYKTAIFSLRLCGKNENINIGSDVETKLINSKTRHATYSRKLIISNFFKSQLTKSLKQIFDIIEYKQGLKKDFRKLEQEIILFNPNLIIVSYTYLLDAVPKNMLNRVIATVGTSYEFHKNTKILYNKLNKYKDKIFKITWPTEPTAELAKKDGLKKSIYIFNPLKFSSDMTADYSNKKAIYIGRISPEKQVDLIIKMFYETISENHLEDWSLEIFGSGELSVESLDIMLKNKNIKHMGNTLSPEKELIKSSVFLLASKYEAFCLALFEANECGVPVIAFEFGEPTPSVITNNKTGIVVERDDINQYKRKLLELISDENLRRRLGKNAKEHSKQANIEKVLDRWENMVLNNTKK